MSETTGAVLLGVGVCAVLVFALLMAARYKPPALLVVSLSVLTLVAILGAAVGRNTEALVALAGTGLGALASAITGYFGENPPRKEEESNDGDT